MRTVITVPVTGLAGALWMGIKMLLPGHNYSVVWPQNHDF
jgi:hypothetical protein